MGASQSVATMATFFIGGAADKNRFWYVGPQTNLIRKVLIERYFYEIKQSSLFVAEINKTLESAYFGYDEMDALFLAIKHIHTRQPSVKIRLIGHSLGAWKAAKLTERLSRELISTALLVTIDPVGIVYFMKIADAFWKLGNDDLTLPQPTAKLWLNILARHTIKYERDDAIADAGAR